MQYSCEGVIRYAIPSQCSLPVTLLQQYLHHGPPNNSPPNQTVQPINLVPTLTHNSHPAHHLSSDALPRLFCRRLIKHTLGGTDVDDPVDDVWYEFRVAL